MRHPLLCNICKITIDAIGFGHENELVIAGELLVADDEGHPILGVIEHLRELRLLPLQVQVLKIHPKEHVNGHTWSEVMDQNSPIQADRKVNVGEVPNYLNCQEWFCRRSLGCRCSLVKNYYGHLSLRYGWNLEYASLLSWLLPLSCVG